MTTEYIAIIILLIIILYLKETTKKNYRNTSKNKWQKNNNMKQKKDKSLTIKKTKQNINNSTYNGYNSLYTKKKKPTMTKQEKKAKGDLYEEYIAKFFREKGYYVWEHGKEKGVQDSSIDLIAKNEQNVYFIQCKNWETWKINHKEIKATRTDIREYLKNNKMFWGLIKNYEYKLLYISPKNCLTKGAYQYIKENNDIIEYQVIPIKN